LRKTERLEHFFGFQENQGVCALEVPGKIKCPYTSLTFSLIACGFLPRPLFFVSSQAKELMCPSPTPESYFEKMFSSAGVGRIFVEGLV